MDNGSCLTYCRIRATLEIPCQSLCISHSEVAAKDKQLKGCVCCTIRGDLIEGFRPSLRGCVDCVDSVEWKKLLHSASLAIVRRAAMQESVFRMVTWRNRMQADSRRT